LLWLFFTATVKGDGGKKGSCDLLHWY
jgi:hypothetical protein